MTDSIALGATNYLNQIREPPSLTDFLVDPHFKLRNYEHRL